MAAARILVVDDDRTLAALLAQALADAGHVVRRCATGQASRQ